MQREAEQRAGQTEGGLTREDLSRLNRAEWEADRIAADERAERSDARRRERERLDAQQPAESIMDEIDPDNTAAMRSAGLGADESPQLTGGMLDALKRPENMIRLAGMGLGLIGILLLLAGLRAEAQVAPGGDPAVATATATASPAGTPLTQASPPVTGTATANASFTKVSGPCKLAARFSDRYRFAATNGDLTLTQLSNGHASRGTIAPSGEFTTMAEGQGYRGRIVGTTATGQHTYTGQGCNEVYDFTMTFPTAFLGGPASAGTANRPPEAGPIRAVQTGTTTTYTVQNVSDPDGDQLRYAWSSTTDPCGTYSGASTPTFSWDHPHPPCPSEPSHPGTITVVIDDGRSAISRTYTRGSTPGTGAVPLAGVGISTIAPSPTAVPTTAAPTSTAAPTAEATSAGTTSGPSIPLILLGGLLTLGGLGLVVRGPSIVGRREERDEDKDPCEEEKRAEADARARRDRARQRRDRIEELRSRHERAQADNERAQREEAASKDDRNVSWGEDADIGPSSRIYTNPDQKARIDRAEAAARAAREAADAARSAYEAAGNGGESAAAQEELAAAESAWQAADAALRRCLQLNAPPPPPPPPAPPPPPPPPTPPTSGPGPTTAGPGGPVTSTPRTTGPTQARECDPPGAERRRPGGTPSMESVWIPDLRGAQLKFDSDMRAVTDFPIDDFIDWASFTKDAFFEGKKIVSLSQGLGPDAGFPVEGALDLAGFPDFLTYYDKMIEMALKALKEAAEQQELIAKNGDYWLEYRSERYELRCEPWQRCVNGRWVDFGKGSFVGTGEMSGTRETRKIQVTADPSAIERAVRDAIDRSFRQVEAAKTSAENQARRFQERCR